MCWQIIQREYNCCQGISGFISAVPCMCWQITEREVSAVREWMKSGLQFHVMRDHPKHDFAILGGLWGLRWGQDLLRDVTKSWITARKLITIRNKMITESKGQRIYGFDQEIVAVSTIYSLFPPYKLTITCGLNLGSVTMRPRHYFSSTTHCFVNI